MKFDAIRVAARALRKQPAFVSAVVVSLALGIAVNTTMYGVLDALIKPRVDMRDPSRLYRAAFFGDYHWTVSNHARDAALMTGLHSYESITRSEQGFGDQLIEHGERARMTPVEGVAANYFDVLGVQPLAGRTFIGADSAAGIRPIVIDETLAEQLFPAGRSPIDARITINLEPRIVVGVISSSSLAPGEHFSAWQIEPEPAAGMYVRLIRLRPGATPQQLDRELQVISARIAATAGEPANGDAFRLHQLMDPDFQFKPIHFGLVAAVVAVLLVACANLANIQLARGIARRRELALRSALGATRQRLVVHLLTESLLLGAGGLLLGLLLTYWVSRLLHASIPPSIGGYIVEPQLSWRVLVFALVATMVCLIAVGLLPSIRVSRTDPNELLKSGAGTGATRGHRRSYAILIGVEIALALALSSFAAITVRTSMHIKDFKYGYDTRPLATGQLSMRSATGRVRAYSDVLASIAAQVRAVRGVEDAAAQSYMMVDKSTITVDDASGPREYRNPVLNVPVVSPSYVRTMGWRIIKGRDFLDGERDHGAVIVDEQTVKILWPNENPIGALIKFGDRNSARPFVRVVGVMGDAEQFKRPPQFGPSTQTIRALGRIFYLPGPSDTLADGMFRSWVTFIARGSKRPEELPVAIRHALQSLPGIKVISSKTMDDDLGIIRDRANSRFTAWLFILFGALGVGLASFGVYGVVAHSVAERRRELGVRVALGASSRDILEAVLRESVVVALAGAAGGLLLTKIGVVLLSQLAAEEIYNAPLFAAVAAFVVAVAALGALVPAMRATRIDPTESLRAE